jgi:hypothetical protein
LGYGALLQEKIFYLYSFALFVTLSYILGALIVRYTLRILKKSPPFLKQEVVRVIIPVLMFTNLYFVYLNVDGGTVTSSFVAIFLAISLLLIVAEPDFVKALSVTVVVNSLGFLLDPSSGPTVVLAIAVAMLMRTVMSRGSLRTLIIQLGELLLGFAGTLLFLVYFFYPTLGSGSISLDYAARPYDFALIQHFAVNTTLPNVLRFTGYTWSTITFAPPTILTYTAPYQGLPGQETPTAVLILPGVVSELWLLSLFAPAAIAASSAIRREIGSIALPFFAIFLVSLGATQWPWFPPSAQAVTTLASLPLIGPLIGEAVFFPFSFMLGEAVAVVVLVGVLLTSVMAGAGPSRSTGGVAIPSVNPRRLGRRAIRFARSISRLRGAHSEGAKWAIIAVITFLVVFPGWQAFNGSYFPSRSYPPYVNGNGVPNAGPFEPVQIPPDVTAAYNYLYDLPGDFNVYWPTGGSNQSLTQRVAFLFQQNDAPKAIANLPALPGLVANGETGALLSYLQAQDVRYLVLQNTSPYALQQLDYGLSNFTALRAFFDSLPDLTPVLSFSNLTIYEVGGTWGISYPVSNIVSYGGSSSSYPTAYSVGSALDSPTAIVLSNPANRTLSIDNLSGSEAILSPSFIENVSGAGTVGKTALSPSVGTFLTDPIGSYENFEAGAGNLSEVVNQAAGTALSIANWSFDDWGPSNVSLSITNESIEWSAQGPTTVSLNAGPSLTEGPGGINITSPNSTTCITSLALRYRVSTGFGGALSTSLVDETINLSAGMYASQSILSPSLSWRAVEFNASTIPWTHYFTTRFQANLQSGSVDVSFANYSWNLPSLNSQWNGTGTLQHLSGWSLLNWSSDGPVSYRFSDGDLSWSTSQLATESLSYGPPLVDGSGGVVNPLVGRNAVSESMSFRYRTSPSFTGSLTETAYYQPSPSSTAGAIGASSLAIPVAPLGSNVTYSAVLPASTRDFNMRFEATDFSWSIQLSDVEFSWAWLPAYTTLPFGVALPVYRNVTVAVPVSHRTIYLLLSGDPPIESTLVPSSNDLGGFSWYQLQGQTIALPTGDTVAAAVVLSFPLSNTTAGIVYTGPLSVDLILDSGSAQYRPYETLDGNALFLFRGSGNFEIVHGSVTYIMVYYFLFLIYLALFCPVLLWIRQRYRARVANKAVESVTR